MTSGTKISGNGVSVQRGRAVDPCHSANKYSNSLACLDWALSGDLFLLCPVSHIQNESDKKGNCQSRSQDGEERGLVKTVQDSVPKLFSCCLVLRSPSSQSGAPKSGSILIKEGSVPCTLVISTYSPHTTPSPLFQVCFFCMCFKNSFHVSCVLQIYGVFLKKNTQHESCELKFCSGSYLGQ